MSELNYGVNVEHLLYDLSQHESDDIGEFDFYCEDESGREGSATIDITLLASDALKLITALKAERDSLAAENKLLDSAIGAIADAHATGVADLLAQEIYTAMSAETPATEAYLNSVRAEGVEMLAKLMEDNGYHSVSVGAKVFSAQLRAGEAK